jgi:hypothetical protein
MQQVKLKTEAEWVHQVHLAREEFRDLRQIKAAVVNWWMKHDNG